MIGVAFYWNWGHSRAMATVALDFTAVTRRALILLFRSGDALVLLEFFKK